MITIHLLPNISWGKGNQAMKFGQIIEYNKKIFFFKSYAENEVERLVLELFLFFKKVLNEVKAKGLQLSFNVFQWSSSRHNIKQTIKNFRLLIQRCAQFLFFRKLFWNSLSTTFCMIFQEKCFSCYILLTDQVPLPKCLYFLSFWSICVL